MKESRGLERSSAEGRREMWDEGMAIVMYAVPLLVQWLRSKSFISHEFIYSMLSLTHTRTHTHP